MILSCRKEPSESENLNESETFHRFDSEQEALNVIGPYAHFFFPKPSGLNIKNFTNPYRVETSASAFYRAAWGAVLTDGGVFSIGDIDFDFISDKGLYFPNKFTEVPSNEDFNNWFLSKYGTTQTFKLLDGNVEIFKKDIYVPKLLQLSTIQGVDNATGKYIVQKDNREIELSWNADNQNKNGLMVFFQWSDGSTFLEKFILIKNDDGAFTIPSSLIAELPLGAMFELTFFRGNAFLFFENEVKRVDNNGFQVYASTETKKTYIVK